MTIQQLATEISRDLTSSCVLPVTVPPLEIQRIIKQSEKWFYINVEESVEDGWCVIPISEFNKPGWKKHRSFKMPDCVVAMTDAPREIKGASFLGINNPDFSLDRMLAASVYLSPMNNGDEMVNMVAQMSFWDLSKSFTVDSLAFSYSEASKTLKIIGRDPRYDVMIRFAKKVESENLYENYYFQRYVTAKAKISLANILGTYQFNLMGGVTINFSDIKSDGKDELTEIKEEIAGQQTADFIMTWH